MNKINTLIVDDEPLARSRIRRLLENQSDITIISECNSAIEVLEQISTFKIDLIFLDIQMPEMSGIELVYELNSENLPAIIFVTAYDKYALKAFELHAVEYLLKPFENKRFYSALDYARQILNDNESNAVSILNAVSDLNSNSESRNQFLKRILIKKSNKMYFITTDEIIMIKAAGKYLEISDSNKTHLYRQTMYNIEKKLDPEKFIRIHRSSIINIDNIIEIQHWNKNEYIFTMSNNIKITSGSSYRINLNKILD